MCSAFARIENHYFVNDVGRELRFRGLRAHAGVQGFMRDGQLLEKQEIDKM